MTTPVAPLPRALADALEAFAGHLRDERDRSPHTVRAYVGDVASLLAHAARLGATDLAGLDLGVLRSWLAAQRTGGAARTTLARRGSAARAFTAWAHRTGRLDSDPGGLLATPKGQRPLPEVLRADEAARLVDGADGDAVTDLRDRLVLELLYATGVRVGELCGLDLDDVDTSRRLLRVLGKGRRERSVPYGLPAQRALDAWLSRGSPGLGAAAQRPGAAAGAARWPGRPAHRPRPGAHPAGGGPRRAGDGPARAAAQRRHAPARGRRGPAQRPGAAGSRYARNDPDLHACQRRTTEEEL